METVDKPLEQNPYSCAECRHGKKYGLVGDVFCTLTQSYFTGNTKPPHKERPDVCPLNKERKERKL